MYAFVALQQKIVDIRVKIISGVTKSVVVNIDIK